MKIIFPTLLLSSFAMAATPDVQIRCIDEVGTSSWLSEILIELDWKGHPMGGLTGYTGTMELKGTAFEGGSEKHHVSTEPSFHVVSWSAARNTYNLKSHSDLFYKVGSKQSGQFTQKNSDQWERSVTLICETVR